jgi:Tol biopolymer transport system component
MLKGTEQGSFPFWSPDGKQLGYFSGGKVMRMDLESGASNVVADAPTGRGASWSPNGTIIFAPLFRSNIVAVPWQGGEPHPVTTVDTGKHTSHRWPSFLSDGEHFVYLAVDHRSPTGDQSALYLGSLKDSSPQLLTKSFCNARVVDGYLLFCREEKLYAQQLDPKTFALRGNAEILVSSIMTDPSTWRAFFGAADSGLFVYAAGESAHGSELVSFDREGRRLGRFGEVHDYYVTSISRDGKKLAAEVADPGPNVWIGDLTRKTFTKLTFSGTSARQPIISPDGTEVIYTSDTPAGISLIQRSTNGLGQERTLVTGPVEFVGNDWSADGKYLLVQRGENGKEYGLFALELSGERRLIPIVVNRGKQIYDGSISPDMKWVLYTLPVNGREEVFVSPFDVTADPNAKEVNPTGRWQISSGGGLGHWSHDGRQIYYVSSTGKMMSVSVHASDQGFESDSPRELFPVSIRNIVGIAYVVTPDEKFIINTSMQPPNAPAHMVTDWHRLLKH